MVMPHHTVGQKLRIRVEELKPRLLSDKPVTVLDARNDQAWESSPVKIRGAIRIQPANWHTDPSWPKDRCLVVY
jgi:predicted sulfurtransferase